MCVCVLYYCRTCCKAACFWAEPTAKLDTGGRGGRKGGGEERERKKERERERRRERERESCNERRIPNEMIIGLVAEEGETIVYQHLYV